MRRLIVLGLTWMVVSFVAVCGAFIALHMFGAIVYTAKAVFQAWSVLWIVGFMVFSYDDTFENYLGLQRIRDLRDRHAREVFDFGQRILIDCQTTGAQAGSCLLYRKASELGEQVELGKPLAVEVVGGRPSVQAFITAKNYEVQSVDAVNMITSNYVFYVITSVGISLVLLVFVQPGEAWAFDVSLGDALATIGPMILFWARYVMPAIDRAQENERFLTEHGG